MLQIVPSAAPRVILTRCAATLVLTSAVLLSTGCEDADATARRSLQSEIEMSTAKLRDATVTVAAPYDETATDSARRTLNEIVSAMGSAGSGTDGQQAAAALLVSSAKRQLALLDFRAVDDARQSALADLHVASLSLDTAQRLAAIASTPRNRDNRTLLESLHDTVSSQRQSLSTQLASLDGPIADRQQRNAADTQRADTLSAQANDAYREATRLGHADGFDSYRRAVGLEREADGIKVEIAQRENELEYTYVPERAWVDQQVASLNVMLSELGSVIEALDAHHAMNDGQAQQTMGLVRRLRGSIDESLSGFQSYLASASGQYDAIIAHLDVAAQKAQSAASKSRAGGKAAKSASTAARLDAAKAHLQRAEVLTHRAQTQMMYHQLLVRLVDAGDVVNGASYRDERDESGVAYQDAASAAVAAYEEAKSQLEQAGGDTTVAGLIMSVDQSIMSLNDAMSGG